MMQKISTDGVSVQCVTSCCYAGIAAAFAYRGGHGSMEGSCSCPLEPRSFGVPVSDRKTRAKFRPELLILNGDHRVAKLIVRNISLKWPCLQECGEKLCCLNKNYSISSISSVLGLNLSCSNRLTSLFRTLLMLSLLNWARTQEQRQEFSVIKSF